MTHPADLFMPTHSKLAKKLVATSSLSNGTAAMLRLVAVERDRQNALVAEGKLPFNCCTVAIPTGAKAVVLGEEYGEVCKAAYESYCAEPGPTAIQLHHLREELIQLAAVAVAWAEAITEDLKSI